MRKFLPLMLVAGSSVGYLSGKNVANADALVSPNDAEVSVTLVLPDNQTLSGTVIIVLEDITFQDSPSVELVRTEIPSATLADGATRITVPFNPEEVDSKATINVAVFIDSDDSGNMSAGDLISNALVPVINNEIMDVEVEVVGLNPP